MLHFVRVSILVLLLARPAWAAGPDPATLDDASLIQLLTEGDGEPLKCGTPYFAELESRGLELPSLAQAEGDTLEYLTPEGHFRIIYNTEGLSPVDPTDEDMSGVPDYVELVGSAFERSWSVEVDSLGFSAPDIGDERYLVSLFLRGSGAFGLTRVPSAPPYPPGGTWIEVHHDMDRFCQGTNDPPDCTTNLLLATVAHEFKHAVQFADGWNLFALNGQWIELDATWIEDLVFDDSNDYYRYLELGTTPFTQPSTSLASNNDYRYATWGHYLGESYGQDIMNDFSDAVVARGFPQYAQHSFVDAVTGRGLDWVETWRGWTGATYLCGDNAAPGLGLVEAPFYPTPTSVTIPSLPQDEVFTSLSDMAMRFYRFDATAPSATGRVEIVFEAVTAVGHWTLLAIYQRADETKVVEIPITDGLANVAPMYRLEDYDSFAVVLGNARVPLTSARTGSYRLTLGVDFTPTRPSSVGGFKGRYRQRAGG
jgi:hypothetical protein